jgi:steroid 5-alpha reductase family enzyme
VPRLASTTRSTGLLVILGVYALATAAAAGSLALAPPGLSLGWQLGAASFAGMSATFLCSLALDNSSAFDAYWSVAPMLTIPWLLAQTPAHGPRAWLVALLVEIWGARLTFNWIRQWHGLGHEDFRYVDLKAATGKAYWLVSYLGIHLFPALLVWAGSLALIPAIVPSAPDISPQPLGLLDLLGAVTTAAGTLIEATGDRQLRSFVTSPHEPGAICDRGLWSWSRHPNYLGEIMFWWGLALIALSAAPGEWRLLAGAIAITLLFNVVSIPMMEKRMAARRPGFAEHTRRVSRLLLWPPRGGTG